MNHALPVDALVGSVADNNHVAYLKTCGTIFEFFSPKDYLHRLKAISPCRSHINLFSMLLCAWQVVTVPFLDMIEGFAKSESSSLHRVGSICALYFMFRVCILR